MPMNILTTVFMIGVAVVLLLLALTAGQRTQTRCYAHGDTRSCVIPNIAR